MNSSHLNLSFEDLPSKESVLSSLQAMVLSVSGWRKVFAEGGEEDEGEEISASDQLLTVAAATVYADFLENRLVAEDLGEDVGDEIGEEGRTADGKSKRRETIGKILLARDSRPTGETLLVLLSAVLRRRDIPLIDLGCAAIPQVVALNSQSERGGFLYCSASHNPVGFNGLKMGFGSSGVAEGVIAKKLISQFQTLVESYEPIPANRLASIAVELFSSPLERIGTRESDVEKSKESYRRLTEEIFFRDSSKRALIERRIEEFTKENPPAVVSEFNGSARALSIDTELFEAFGFRTYRYNDTPGVFSHAILPERESLEPACELVQRVAKSQNGVVLGYVPDCDGDRGNLVYYSHKRKKSVPLQAQEVFSLCALSETLFRLWLEEKAPLGVVCNGPTSQRIEAALSPLGVRVERCEVGEANVVQRAYELEREGFTISLLGEGSNGGSILLPSLVRDPLNTVLSLLRLLVLGSDDSEKQGLVSLWAQKDPNIFDHLKRTNKTLSDPFTLDEIIAMLPSYTTSETSDPMGMVRGITGSHQAIKNHYESIFEIRWREEFKEEWRERGVETYRFVQTEGVEQRIGRGDSFRSGKMSGGLKVELLDNKGGLLGFLWLRGSGTEPMWRILVDFVGECEEWATHLLKCQREMIESAEKASR